MRQVREWLKANGGAPAVVALGGALSFAYLPLGLTLVAVGLLGWLYSWERFPFTVSRRQAHARTEDGLRLLGLAQEIKTELMTCRTRLLEAKEEGRGWLLARQLPAETYNARWTPSALTADRISVNDALRHFYVWADAVNGDFAGRAAAEETAVGLEFHGQGRALDDADRQRLDDGLGLLSSAEAAVNGLITHPTRSRYKPTPGLLAAVVIGLLLGFGLGFAVFEWTPWKTTERSHNRFLGLGCQAREAELESLREGSRLAYERANEELDEANRKEPCEEETFGG